MTTRLITGVLATALIAAVLAPNAASARGGGGGSHISDTHGGKTNGGMASSHNGNSHTGNGMNWSGKPPRPSLVREPARASPLPLASPHGEAAAGAGPGSGPAASAAGRPGHQPAPRQQPDGRAAVQGIRRRRIPEILSAFAFSGDTQASRSRRGPARSLFCGRAAPRSRRRARGWAPAARPESRSIRLVHFRTTGPRAPPYRAISGGDAAAFANPKELRQ